MSRNTAASAVTDYEQRVRALVAEHPRMSDDRLAKLIVDETPAEDHRSILIGHTAFKIAVARRIAARAVEEDARCRAAKKGKASVPTQAETSAPTDFERLYADPALWSVSSGEGRDRLWFNSNERRSFKAWCRHRDGKDGFDRWLARALAQTESTDFRVDWVEGYFDQQRLEVVEAAVETMLTGMAESIRFEVTAELLDTVFATGDGTRVSWRDATVLQHQERIEHLTKMITGTAETAAMHLRAVEMIKDAGVESLGQVVP